MRKIPAFIILLLLFYTNCNDVEFVDHSHVNRQFTSIAKDKDLENYKKRHLQTNKKWKNFF